MDPVLVITLLSIAGNILIPLIYRNSQISRHHPAKLISIISILDLMQSVHFWIWIQIDTSTTIAYLKDYKSLSYLHKILYKLEKSSQLCLTNKSMYFIFLILSICYNICLSMDLKITLMLPFYSGKKRIKYYNAISILAASFIYWMIKDQIYHQCLKVSERDQYYSIIYIHVLWIVLIIIGINSIYNGILNYRNTPNNYLAEAKKAYIVRHSQYILLLISIQILPTFRSINKLFYMQLQSITTQNHPQSSAHDTTNINKDWIDEVCFIMSISSSLILALFRITEDQFFIHIKLVLLKIRDQQITKNQLSSNFKDIQNKIESMQERKEQDHDVWQVPLAFLINVTNSQEISKSILYGIIEILQNGKVSDEEVGEKLINQCSKLIVKQDFNQKLIMYSQKKNKVIREQLNVKVKYKKQENKRNIDNFKMIKKFIDNNISNIRRRTSINDEQQQQDKLQCCSKQKEDPKQSSTDTIDQETIQIKIQIIEYAPQLFEKLRNLDRVDKDIIVNSLDILNNKTIINDAKESAGKSGSLFIKTWDDRFILKTITYNELESLKNILPSYFQHIVFDNTDSLLSRIYGAFTIDIDGSSSINMILMENANRKMKGRIIKTYDLKGSLVNRINKFIQKDQDVLMDINFIESEDTKVYLKEKDQKDLLTSLKKDVFFLKSNELMDYSFLYVKGHSKSSQSIKNKQTGFKRFREIMNNEGELCYSFSIIDYLQKYGASKQIESAYKRVLYYSSSHFVSCVHPKLYAKRFLDFIKPIFKRKDRKNQQSIDLFLKKNQ